MDPVDVILEAIAQRLGGRAAAVQATAQKYPAASPNDLSADDLKKFARELREVTSGLADLKKAQKALTADQDAAEANRKAQFRAARKAMTQYERDLATEERDRQRLARQTAAAQKRAAAEAARRGAEITMGRLPIASIPAMLHGNTSAGARVGYALGEHSAIGKWGGLGLGAGVAGAIGAGFAATPMGTDIIYQPFKILAGTIGVDVLPALHRFAAMLLDVADWWKENRGVATTAVTTVAVGATALGGMAAVKGAAKLFGFGEAAAGGAAAAGVAASGTMSLLGKAGAASKLLKGLGNASIIGGAVMEGPDMIAGLGGGGSNEGRGATNSALRYLVSGLAGTLGFMVGGPAGAAAAGFGAWSLTSGKSSGFGSGSGGTRTPTANEMMLYQENLQRIGGRASTGTDLTQIQRDVQMASFESPMELRMRQVYMEGVDKIAKAIKGE